jgi:flagellar motor component MotA
LENIFVISGIDFKALLIQFRSKKIQVILHSIYSTFTNFTKTKPNQNTIISVLNVLSSMIT